VQLIAAFPSPPLSTAPQAIPLPRFWRRLLAPNVVCVTTRHEDHPIFEVDLTRQASDTAGRDVRSCRNTAWCPMVDLCACEDGKARCISWSIVTAAWRVAVSAACFGGIHAQIAYSRHRFAARSQRARHAQERAQYLHQFVLHASLDAVDEQLWNTTSMHLGVVDKFNNLHVRPSTLWRLLRFRPSRSRVTSSMVVGRSWLRGWAP